MAIETLKEALENYSPDGWCMRLTESLRVK